jgi:hypothetical protein
MSSASPVLSNRSILKRSLTNVKTQSSDENKESSTNFTTTTLDTGTSAYSSSYYTTPSNEISNGSNSSGRNSSLIGPNKTSHRNPFRFDTNTINSQRKRNSSLLRNTALLSAYSMPSLVSQLDSYRAASPGKYFENVDFLTRHF